MIIVVWYKVKNVNKNMELMEKNMEEYLYHYTSIETLEKNLDTKSICFTNLDLVDDLDEVETADIKKFGRFCFVSCWTKEEKESIPMWKMYTPEMQGVRIKMRKFPFVIYTIQPGQLANEEEIKTYINMIERHTKNLPYILHTYPELLEVDYTEREELLYPKVKTENSSLSTEEIVDNGQKKTIVKTNIKVSYATKYIGVFKRKCWEFQKEWRYKLILAPYTYKELAACKTRDDQMHLLQRLEDVQHIPKENRIFIDLEDNAIKDMEILIGPRATDSQIEIVRNLALKNGIDISKIRKSDLRIR